MGGFADEVAKINSGELDPENQTGEQSDDTSQEPQGEDPDRAQLDKDLFDSGLPVGSETVDGKTVTKKTVTQETNKTGEPDAGEGKTGKIRIGAREFDDVASAMKYAEELEIARAEDKGFIEGVKAAKGETGETKQEQMKALEEQVEEKFFEDPKTAIKMLIDGVKKIINDDLTQAEQMKAQAQAQKAQHEALWTAFYTDNPDLSESRDVVEFLLKKNWNELGNIPMRESLPKLADIARKQLKITRQESLPKKDLPSKKAVMPGTSTSSTTQQTESTDDIAEDFVSQVSRLRKRSS